MWWSCGTAMRESEVSFADGEGERTIGSPSMKRRKNDNRKSVILATGKVTTEKINHFIQTKNRVLSSKRTASEKLIDHWQRYQSDNHKHSPVYLLLPLACGKKIWLFKCLQMSQLLWRPLPKAMKGSLFPFSPVSDTTIPEVDFYDRDSSNLKFLSSPQLNFKTKHSDRLRRKST